MKLSAPSLPFDFKPTLPNPGGRQATRGGSGDSSARSSAKFGEILSENVVRPQHAEKRARSTPTSRATPDVEPNDSAPAGERATDGELNSPETPANTAPVIIPEAIAPLPSPPISIEPAMSASETKDDVAITSTDVGLRADAETTASTPTAGSNDEVRFPGRAANGRPFSGNMPVGKSQALYRAFGLNAQRVAAAKLVDVPQIPDEPQAPLVLPPPSAETENSESPAQGVEPTVVPPVDSSVVKPPVIDASESEPSVVEPSVSEPFVIESSESIVVEPSVVAEGPPALEVESGEPEFTVSPEKASGGGEVIAEDIFENIDLTVPVVATPTSSAGTTGVALDMSVPDTAVGRAAELPVEALEIGQQIADTGTVEIPETAVEPTLSEIILPTTPQPDAQNTENFADLGARLVDSPNTPDKQPLITALSIEAKGVVRSYGRIGINAAKTESLMADAASLSTPPPVATSVSPLGLAPVAFDAQISAPSDQASADVNPAARRAVESALAVAEQFTPGEQRSVRLHFNVGGEDLAVRVELRGEQVHTTFRTDSPELRSALAREWQAVSSTTSADRGQRLADPVFASAGNSLSADSGAAHQRQPETRDAHVAAHDTNQMRRALRSSESDPVMSEDAPSVQPQQFNSSRLHTFA